MAGVAMAKSTKIRRATRAAKSPDQIAAEKALAIGVPAMQVMRGNLREIDVKLSVGERAETYRTVRKLTILDRWFKEGGAGFEEPQKRAVEWVEKLWEHAGYGGPVMPKYGSTHAGSPSDGQRQQDALTQLAILKTEIPRPHWSAFEDIVRHNISAGTVGEELTKGTRPHDYARACVGFVASIIAMRRGF